MASSRRALARVAAFSSGLAPCNDLGCSASRRQRKIDALGLCACCAHRGCIDADISCLNRSKGLLLCLHNAGKGGITGLIEALLRRQHCGQRHFDDFLTAHDLATDLGALLIGGNFNLGYERNMGNAQIFGKCDADLALVVINFVAGKSRHNGRFYRSGRQEPLPWPEDRCRQRLHRQDGTHRRRPLQGRF